MKERTSKKFLSMLVSGFLLCYPGYVSANGDFSGEPSVVQQAGKTVTGTVVDIHGEPLIGVSVGVQGTKEGAVTDMSGHYSVQIQNDQQTLEFSYIGYKKVTVTANRELINVTMEEDTGLLEEVVVVGYGIQKKVNLTGSVAAIGVESLESRVNTNLLSSVQGQVPGVTIISRPGQTPSINFRGRGNLGTSEPLYVIDGAIATSTFFANLDPSTIESMSFLKDASSSSIYGSRAAYGVVLVKTKSGKKGATMINYNGYVGLKEATYKPKVLDSEWYATLWNEAALNGNPNLQTLPYSDEMIQKYRTGSDPDLYPNSKWLDMILDDYSFITQHSLSFSGGGDKNHYAATLGYTDDHSFVPGEGTKRYNLTTNLSSDLKDWLTLRTDIKFIQSDYARENGPVSYVDLLVSPTTYVARQSNGEYGTIENGKAASSTAMNRNPLRKFEKGGWSNSVRRNTNFSLGADIKPLKDLVLTGEMNYRWADYKLKTYTANIDEMVSFLTGLKIPGTSVVSKMEYDWDESTNLTYNGLANYRFSLNDTHNFTLFGGVSYEHYKYQKQKSSRKNFPTNGMTDLNGGSSTPEDMATEGGSKENKMFSYFGRITYNYMERYLLEAVFRSDASSRFHKDFRQAYFPSFSGAWRISEEAFMESADWLSNLKLRASWGKLGNINNVEDYDYFSTYKLTDSKNNYNYNFEDSPVGGIVEAKPANNTLTWEKVTITDVGLDIGLLNNRLNIVADWYNKKTNAILLPYNVPAEAGIHKDDKPSQNIGSLENRGLEFAISYNDKIGDFTYHIGGNISKNTNKILELGDSDPIYSEPWIQKVGYAIGTYYVYRTDGLLTQEDIDKGNYITDGVKPNAGDVKYVDLNPDGKLNGEDRDYYGCDVPNLTYGVDLSVGYKGFELSMFGQGVSGTKVRFYQEMAWAFSDFASPREFHLKRWTTENPDPKAAYPRIYERTNAHSTYNQKLSDFWLFSSDYFRIKNITFGYSFPKQSLSKAGLGALKVYLAAENPFTVRADKRMGDFDPESPSGRGTESRGTRVYSFGVNVSF